MRGFELAAKLIEDYTPLPPSAIPTSGGGGGGTDSRGQPWSA
jgi:hypothetical protein